MCFDFQYIYNAGNFFWLFHGFNFYGLIPPVFLRWRFFLFLAVWIYDSIFTNMIAAENKIEIVQGIANGVSVKNIAKELNISTRTIEKYLEQLRFEYKATATCHLVAIFLRKKIIK